ncbi:DUF5979 domain-containing protein [Pseudoglutamicibacter albus]|uniref:Gram-positive cocci surface proteins LPxTG domain-containing protein n=1 Tax=Pseudoglutamicibacter albus TaxID=98671 RepID=A0ABU1YY56_9MICC|nr:DUF5979 domain-containing protein [Pseudoglutamicibacter albus]MDR7293282.1 hypothetical protein [Pseudoglutamicibacter albus]
MKTKKSRLGGLLLAMLLGAASLVGITPAQAAPDFTYPGAMSDVNVTFKDKDGGQARVDDEVKVTAKWNVPNGAQAGETFGMTLPKEFSNYGNGEFSVPDKETGETVANCKVTNEPAPTVTCTLTDFVNGKEDVGGELWFLATLDEQSDNNTADFIIDGKTVPVPIPGDGGIGPVGPGHAADDPYKYSARTKHGADVIAWGIQFPNTVAEDGTVTVTDAIVDNTEFERHKANNFDIEVEYRNVAEDGTFVEGEDWAPVDPADFETNIAEGSTNFTVTVKNVPTNKRVQYRILYWTKMDGKAFEGDVFKNTAKVNGKDAEATFTYTAIGGGTGSGKEYTRFSIAKAVEGNGADQVPAGTKYTVKYTAAGEEDTLELEAGEENRVNSKRYKIGTEFKITEVNLPEVDGIEWGDYEITGDGVTKNEDGSFSVTPATNEPAKLTLVNKAEKKVQNGNLSVTKAVTGDGADLVPADTEYNVKYSYELDGEEKTGTLTVKNGETVSLPEDVPAGTKVRLTEEKPADFETEDGKKVIYGEPKFFIGDELCDDILVTVEGDKTKEIKLENPTTVEEPEPEPEPSEEPEPSDEPTPEPSEEPEPSDEPTPEPSEEPEPSDEPTPEPSEEPEPSDEPTPEPSDEPTPEPSEEPTPEPSEEPTPEPSESETPAPEPTETDTPEEPGKKPGLASTGVENVAVGLGVALLLAAGGATLLVVRKRKNG